MVDPKLVEYIENCRKLGMSEAEIRSKLQAAGWQDLQIGEAFTSSGNTTAGELSNIYTNYANSRSSNLDGLSGSDIETKTILSKKKMFVITGSVFIGMLLIVGGVFAYSYLSPIVTKYLTLSSLGKITSGHMEGRLVLKPASATPSQPQKDISELTLTADGYFDYSNGFQNDVSTKIEVPAGYINPELDIITSKNELYFKLANLPIPETPGQPALQNRWFYFESQTDKNKKPASAQTSTQKPKSNLSKSLSEVQVFKTFRKITDESVKGIDCNQFTFDIDKSKFSDNLITYLDENGTLMTAGEKADLKKYIAENVKSLKGDLLIGKKDHTIRRIDLYLSTKELDIDSTFVLSEINQKHSFKMPTDAKSFKDTFNIKDQPLPIFSPGSVPMSPI